MSEMSAAPGGAPQAIDERRIARGVAIGLPIVTLSTAGVVGVLLGPATSILVIAAGILLGVIALLWGSLRVLSGDAPLPPDLEALEMESQGVDALATRKKMLLRALKDLENERAIGKLDEDDFEPIAATYRSDLKACMRQMDDALDPHRSQAEEAIRAHLVKAGLVPPGYRGAQPSEEEADALAPAVPAKKADAKREPAAVVKRLACPKCGESNEPDAKFCKECATKLVAASAAVATEEEEDEDEDEDDESESDDEEEEENAS